MRVSVIIILSALLAGAFSCSNPEAPERQKGQTRVFAREPNDSAAYRHMKYGFYSNKSGQLFERKLVMARLYKR